MVDAASLTALGGQVVRPPFLCYLDIVGDPVRVTTWETPVAPSGTGDADLDGYTFMTVDPSVVDIGQVVRQTGGSDQVTLSLSGIVGPDSSLLDLLGDPTKWKGRVARLWFMLYNESHAQVGVVFPYATIRMMGMSIKGSSTAQTVDLVCESYLASISSASNRSYLDQADFDPNDTSAGETIAVANGATAGAVASTLTVGNGYVIGGGGAFSPGVNFYS